MTDTGEVRTETANCVAKVTFSHPKGNSLPGQLLRSLANTFTSLSSDDQVRVILLTSNGEKAFCAGASFDELIAIEDERAGLEFFSGFAHVINAMRKCPKPIVCRAQGKVVGGGVGLVSASDYALAHSSASVKLSELA
ncbi:MAG: enoyl-CoA hydratase/isomerase family protein, partial [Bdellovibrionales bacterium]|nr:enoyl-CoA hydratase/isomerase family protein [Bdellovibrionales bacterium]